MRNPDSPSSVGPEAPEITSVLGDTIGPRDSLSIHASTSPEPPLSFTSNKSHELLGKGDVVEGDGPHAAAGANPGNLVTTELSTTGPPWDPEVSSPWLIVGCWGAAATTSTSLEGPASRSSWSAASKVKVRQQRSSCCSCNKAKQ